MLAAVFLAFTVLHIRDSHFYLTDVPMTFFVVLTVFFAAGIVEGKGIKSYILTGVFAGVGIATKQTALMVFPVILAAHIIGMFKNQQVPTNSIKKVILSYQFWGLLLVPFLIAGITFLLLDPFVLINLHKFLDVSHQTAMFVKGIRQNNWTFQFTGTKISYWFTNLLYFGMGPLLELVSLIGVLWAIVNGVLRVAGHRIKNRYSADLLMLSFLLPYLYFIGGGYMKFIRYAIPLLPFLCLLGARFMLDIYEMTTHKNVRIAVGALIAMVIITSFLYALAYLNIYRQEDVRIQASKWIHQHIPPESTILVDSSSATPLLGSMFFQPQLYNSYNSGFGLRSLYKKDYFRIKILLLILEIHHFSRSQEWWEKYLKGRLENVDYIIMSDEYYEQFSHRPNDYPTINQFYQDLFTGKLGFQQIRTYKTHPSLFGYALNDDRAELSFRLFDHPKIMIFKRNRP
jgi:dolichyl-phosphate-mannose--protein O-mannosyl transferase